MLAQRIARLARAQTAFPNTTSAGYYEFVSRAITVLTADGPTLEAWANADDFLAVAAEYLTTAIHELTHWMDHSSTLWGQRQIVTTHNAIAAWEFHRPEEFWRVRELEKDLQRGTALEFYQVIDQPSVSGKAFQWLYMPTIGLQYGSDGRPDNDRPIPLLSFEDLKGDRIARVPLSTLALLEANAVWGELFTRSQIHSTLPDDVRPVELAVSSKEILSRLYDPNLSLYSAAVHVVAGSQQTSNASTAYMLASALATMVLNLPAAYYDVLTVPDSWRTGIEGRGDRLLKERDHGFAFLLLNHAAPRFESGTSIEAWTDAVLLAASLPNRMQWTSDFNSELKELELFPSRHSKRTKEALELGLRHAALRGLTPEEPLSLASGKASSGIRLPAIALADDTVVPFGETLAESPELTAAAVDVCERFEAWARTFGAACRA